MICGWVGSQTAGTSNATRFQAVGDCASALCEEARSTHARAAMSPPPGRLIEGVSQLPRRQHAHAQLEQRGPGLPESRGQSGSEIVEVLDAGCRGAEGARKSDEIGIGELGLARAAAEH